MRVENLFGSVNSPSYPMINFCQVCAEI